MYYRTEIHNLMRNSCAGGRTMRALCRSVLCVAALGVPFLALGDSFSMSNTGTFATDNALQPFAFTLLTPSLVTMQSWGFAGGTNSQGVVISAGGFATVLALFDSAGMEVGNLDQGGFPPNNCAPRNVDPASGLCLDAYLSETLLPGSYTLELSQQPNTPNDIFLADGYTFDGDPNFAGGFNDFGLQRTDAWAVDITAANITTRSLTA
jgi:hypothetical protein